MAGYSCAIVYQFAVGVPVVALGYRRRGISMVCVVSLVRPRNQALLREPHRDQTPSIASHTRDASIYLIPGRARSFTHGICSSTCFGTR